MIKKSILNILIQILRNLPGASQASHQIASLKDIRNLVCYNQSNLANYIFLSSRKHKRLKTALAAYKDIHTTLSSSKELDELKNAYKDLSDYLEADFRRVSAYHFEYIVNIFKKKSITPKSPRICIKGFREDHIVSLARDKYDYNEEDYPLTANTAFQEIINNRSYYLCNNIPFQIQKRNYRNARICEHDVINNYKSNVLLNLKFWLSNSADKNWQRCWNRTSICGEIRFPPIDSCYKATLVVPMSLPGDRGWLSREFRDHFKINVQTPRTGCFGFLCLDHQNIRYFKNEDIDISYVFADLLSLYLIQKLTCSAYSSVWREAAKIVVEGTE